jgi:hypothetical protein
LIAVKEILSTSAVYIEVYKLWGKFEHPHLKKLVQFFASKFTGNNIDGGRINRV